MKSIKNIVVDSKIFQSIYKTKWYFDRGVGQIAWITNKLPDVMAIVYLAEKFGYVLKKGDIVVLVIIGTLLVIVFGMFLKHTGLYDTEIYVEANKNPVQAELLDAARLIKKRYK